MGFTEVLTIIFIVLKLIGKIGWNWFLVLLPEIIAIAFYIIVLIIQLILFFKFRKRVNKAFKNDFFKKF
ncbi:hypothetical protein PU629_06300 [Pullulanibacillus sp. KACC 23026]|uniref:hypothetical protein n=1 Tax=Pullulanibacillus sp. KACC 23026 TaxID=3028315 RepID=UPI0023AF1417|nr:hypothetical protein [Pullulanibacillus sp. KACC 23026]WEG13975.1 hypothetical protein PU629_06300 [Pullulanibacillus sp. KACC 23026]